MKNFCVNRRQFVKTAMWGSAALGLAGIPFLSGATDEISHLCILHTNDTHSRITPYPVNDPRYPGMGGYSRRAALIDEIRKTNKHVLLLDAGDIFQGTAFYNAFGGEPELRLMTHMQYDAATMGNHEFDNGLDGFLKVMPFAQFPFITSNYDFTYTQLSAKTIPYLILNKGLIKIGIYGLGIELKGLVGKNLYGDTIYHDPVKVAQSIEILLKEELNCDLVICLSHLGFQYDNEKVSDQVIARNTRYTNIILGGHTHHVLSPAVQIANLRKKIVYIGQAGYGGVRIGRMDVYFDNNNSEILVDGFTTNIFKNQVT
jgi:5'-nucleotidase